MSSHSLSLNPHFSSHRLSRSSNMAPVRGISPFRSVRHRYELNGSKLVRHCGHQQRPRVVEVQAMDGDSYEFSSFDYGDGKGAAGYTISSSESEDSDGDYALNLVAETTAQRLDRISKSQKRHRIRYGVFINLGLVSFLTALLVFVDFRAWKIVRLPLEPLYLMRPFFVSALLVSSVGFIFVPFSSNHEIYQVDRKREPVGHSMKRKIPKMVGLYFVPIGATVAKVIANSSTEVSGAVVATLAFVAIGFVHDMLRVSKNRTGLPAWLRFLLEASVGICFSFWLDATSISSPYGMKWIVPLPTPVGLVSLGKFYFLSLTSVCFLFMGNAVDITDAADGLVGGIAALAFVGMSIAVLPICQGVSVFGASMAGACVGFLLHNRYKASIVMGNTGSLALGGSLAAMAACSGMFLPLLISSGFFCLEALFFVIQVAYYRMTKGFGKSRSRFYKVAPFHRQLELFGMKKPLIVGGAYVFSCVLSLCAAYVGLVSV